MSLPTFLIKAEMTLRRLAGGADSDYSHHYWRARYRWGGYSGRGSRGETAARKSAFVTEFCKAHAVARLVELGCGDGFCAARIAVPAYLGLDISEDALATARRRCDPATHSFRPIAGLAPDAIAALAVQALGAQADASLSMDVILHLIEDPVFEAYMDTLVALSGRYILIFSSDIDSTDAAHVRHRAWSKWFEANYPVRLIHCDGEGREAHFRVYEKL